MEDVKQSEIVENVDVVAEVVDYKAKWEETQKKLDGIASHHDKLLSETKKAKQERTEAAQAAEAAELAKALKDGEYEKLYQSNEKEKADLVKQLSDIRTANKNEKIQINAMKIASELADGDNVELLSEFIQKNLNKLAEEDGSIKQEVIDSVRNDYKNNPKFKALLRSSRATGGGATGQTAPVATSSNPNMSATDRLQAYYAGKQ